MDEMNKSVNLWQTVLITTTLNFELSNFELILLYPTPDHLQIPVR